MDGGSGRASESLLGEGEQRGSEIAIHGGGWWAVSAWCYCLVLEVRCRYWVCSWVLGIGYWV
jgi:hypothetical protein